MRKRSLVAGLIVAIALCLATATALAQGEGVLTLSAETTEMIETGVVYIHAEWKDSDGAIQDSWGSGFFISEHEILTNHHVVAEAISRPGTRITIRTHSGTHDTQRYEVYVESIAEDDDLALLTVRKPPVGVQYLSLSAEEAAKNSVVLGFGFPMGNIFDPNPNGPGVAVRRGYVSRITHDGATIEADMNIDHGMSGGPATNGEGLVAGMVSSMGGSSDNPTAFAFLISGKTLMQFLKTAGSEVVAAKPGSATSAEGVEVAGPAPGEKKLRSFFSLGMGLRLGTLITSLFEDSSEDADPALVPTAKRNVDNAVAHLLELDAPAGLVARGEKIKQILEAGEDISQAAKLSADLEKACDEWAISGDVADSLERLNYAFGAWVQEMSLGLIDAAKDRETCRMFQTGAELQKAPEAVLALLNEIQEELVAIDEQRSVTGKDVIAKKAEALISVGFLGPTSGTAATTADKTIESGATDQGRPGTNRIKIPVP